MPHDWVPPHLMLANFYAEGSMNLSEWGMQDPIIAPYNTAIQ